MVSTSTVAALAPRAKITGTVATGAIGLQLLKLKMQLLPPLFTNKNMVSTSTPSNPVTRRRSPDNVFQRSRSFDRTEALEDSPDEAMFFACSSGDGEVTCAGWVGWTALLVSAMLAFDLEEDCMDIPRDVEVITPTLYETLAPLMKNLTKNHIATPRQAVTIAGAPATAETIDMAAPDAVAIALGVIMAREGVCGFGLVRSF